MPRIFKCSEIQNTCRTECFNLWNALLQWKLVHWRRDDLACESLFESSMVLLLHCKEYLTMIDLNITHSPDKVLNMYSFLSTSPCAGVGNF